MAADEELKLTLSVDGAAETKERIEAVTKAIQQQAEIVYESRVTIAPDTAEQAKERAESEAAATRAFVESEATRNKARLETASGEEEAGRKKLSIDAEVESSVRREASVSHQTIAEYLRGQGRSLEDVQGAYKSFGITGKAAADEIARAFGAPSEQVKAFQNLLSTAATKMGVPVGEVSTRIAQLGTLLGGTGAAILEIGTVAGIAAVGMYELGSSFAQTSESIVVQSAILGLSTDMYQMVGRAAEHAGLSADGARYGFMMLSRQLAQASDEGGASADKMEKLGILGLSTSEAVGKLVESLKNEATAGEMTARVRETLGMRGIRLLPILQQMADESKRTGKSVAELTEDEKYAGIIFDEVSLAAGKQARVEVHELEDRWTALYNTMKKGALPVFEDIHVVLVGVSQVVIEVAATVHAAGEIFAGFIQTDILMLQALVDLATWDGDAWSRHWHEWLGALKLDWQDLVHWFGIGLKPPEAPTAATAATLNLAKATKELAAAQAAAATQGAAGDAKMTEALANYRTALDAVEAEKKKAAAAPKPAAPVDYDKELKQLKRNLDDRLVLVAGNKAAESAATADFNSKQLALERAHAESLKTAITAAKPGAGQEALLNELDNVNKKIIKSQHDLTAAQIGMAAPGEAMSEAQLEAQKKTNDARFAEEAAAIKNRRTLNQTNELEELAETRDLNARKIEAEIAYLKAKEYLEVQKAGVARKPTAPIVEKYEGEVEAKRIEAATDAARTTATINAKEVAQGAELARVTVAGYKSSSDQVIALQEFTDKELYDDRVMSADQYAKILENLATKRTNIEIAEATTLRDIDIAEGGKTVAQLQADENKITAAVEKGEADKAKAKAEGHKAIEDAEKRGLDRQLAIEDEGLKHSIEMTKLTNDEQVRIGAMSRAQQLSDEKAALNRQYEADRAALQRQLDLEARQHSQQTDNYKRMLDQMTALDHRHELESKRIDNAIADESRRSLTRIGEAIRGSMTSVITGQTRLKDAWASLWNAMVARAALAILEIGAKFLLLEVLHRSSLARQLGAWVLHLGAKTTAEGASLTQQIAAQLAGDAAKTASVATAATTQAAAEATASTAKVALNKATNMLIVTSEAGLAGAAQFANVMVAVPFPANLSVAPAMALAAVAETMSFGIAERGGLLKEEMLLIGHPKELVLPEHISTPLQEALHPPAYRPTLMPPASDRGSRSGPPMRMTYAPQIRGNADSDTKKMLAQHSRDVALMVRREVRRGSLSPR
jgi:hypothetical protein